jgi:hypothetical protein
VSPRLANVSGDLKTAALTRESTVDETLAAWMADRPPTQGSTVARAMPAATLEWMVASMVGSTPGSTRASMLERPSASRTPSVLGSGTAASR